MTDTDCVQKIDIALKQQIDQIRLHCRHTSSSHAFPSLYLWKNHLDLSILLQENFFAVKYGRDGDHSWFFPCGDEEECYDFVCRGMQEQSFSLSYLRECDVSWLNSRFPDQWLLEHTDDSDEYICDIAEYTGLTGSKFSEIRRKIRKLDKMYQIRSAPVSDANINDVMSVVSKWYEVPHNVGEHGFRDEEIAEEVFRHWEELDISGVITYADAVPTSVFAGFPLCGDTIDIVVGKSVPGAPKGMVYYALRECLKQYEGQYVYCNHEEDLGIPGIRQMKNSLCPVTKNLTWKAVLK
ncbi:MAG: phosphatidylglycerol lysyltransferase domain-containing protein [Oscillospiraceae bacterium]|nr:phosphatidylglycerol lysyltransferase domain-containing protein [Oscillospiraceae bacterium]